MSFRWNRCVGSFPGRAAAAFLGVLAAASASFGQSRPLAAPDFVEIAPQGFGDRNNSQPWAMIEWNHKIYVGTGRATSCVQQAVLAYYAPELGQYPPKEEDIECTDSPQDLPLQAEIWRYTPESDLWELVYRSPNDVPIPDQPGKFTARDIGFRGMLIFEEADGTEALYVSGVSARSFNAPGIPPPRLLRSTDGVNFEPVPQDPGTFLGDIPYVGFRALRSYKGRLFALASVGQLGQGVVLESANPEQGNDTFHLAAPAPGETTIYEFQVFNGSLYLGTGVQPVNDQIPFSVLKTDAEGTPPYDLVPIITDGAYRKVLTSYSVISMTEFKNRLYVGTERELFRINPDDSWDLVVGTPRHTPVGNRKPTSGFDYGFDNMFNIHMWRSVVHDGVLYVGTQDQTTKWRNNPFGKAILARLGFDLYATTDGVYWTEVTRDAFTSYFDHESNTIVNDPNCEPDASPSCNVFNNGVRNFVSTEYGLFMGSANHYYGTKIWLAKLPDAPEIPPPGRLMSEGKGSSTLLSWEPSPGATLYQIWRDQGYEAAAPIATTPDLYYLDTTAENKTAHYAVVALGPTGQASAASNMVRAPYLGEKPKYLGLFFKLSRLGLPFSERLPVLLAARQALARNYDPALATLDDLRARAVTELPAVIGPTKAEDLTRYIDGLIRRTELGVAGLLPGYALIF